MKNKSQPKIFEMFSYSYITENIIGIYSILMGYTNRAGLNIEN